MPVPLRMVVICAVASGAAAPVAAAASMHPLRLVERAPAQVVAGRSPVSADMTIPGGGGCNEAVCLYTWTQTAIGNAPKDTYFVRTTLAGKPIDKVGQILGVGDGQTVSHFASQVLSLDDDFGVIWRGRSGLLRYRRIPSKGDVSWGDPIDLGPTIAAHHLAGTNFAAVRLSGGFALMWITSEGSRAFWNVQTFDEDGVALTPEVRFAAPVRGGFHAVAENAGVIVAVAHGDGRPILAAVSATGDFLRSAALPPGPMGVKHGPAVLRPQGRGFELVRVWHADNQFTIRRLAVAGDGTFDAGSELTVGSTEESRPGWRVKLAMQGGTGVLMWINGFSSQDRASVFARRFDLATGWVDGEALPVSGVVRSALEDADLFVSPSHFMVVWNDPIRTNARTSCSWGLPVTGDAGVPACEVLSINVADPVEPKLHVSERGYLIGWRLQEVGTTWSNFPRYLRHAPNGTRVDQAEFTLPDGAGVPIEGGPNHLVFHSGFDIETNQPRPPLVLNLQAPPFVGGHPFGSANVLARGVWTGERYLTVAGDDGNFAPGDGSVRGQFVNAEGLVEAMLPRFGTWRVSSPGAAHQNRIAIGTRRVQHLVVWMHERLESTLAETFNEYALLDQHGLFVEGGGFGELLGHSEAGTSACFDPAAVAGDADGFLIACRTSVSAIKFLGYQPGAPPWTIGMLSTPGTTNARLRVWGDGIHLVWARGQEIVQSLVRRQGRTVVVETDQHVFPYPVANPSMASADDARVALIYRRGAEADSELVFHLLDPDAPLPVPVPDAGADASADADSPQVYARDAGCQCRAGGNNRPSWAPLLLLVAVAAAYGRRRIARAALVIARWTWLLTLLIGLGCERSELLEADAATGGGTPDGGALAFDGPETIDLPPPGPLPIFTPAPMPVPDVPQPVVRVDTSVDCDTGVAAQILGGDRFATVQGALASAAEGDTVQICPGQHHGGFLVTSGITLTSYSGDAGDTILDGQSKARVVRVAIEKGTMPFRMLHLTVRNGVAPHDPSLSLEAVGGGMHIASVVPVQIDACRFENNAAAYGGGAIRLLVRTTTTIRGAVFRENKASYEGGGLSIAYSSNGSRMTIEDCVFEKNTAIYSGGALDVSHFNPLAADSFMMIVRSSFRDNTAGHLGGAIEVSGREGSRLQMVIESSRLQNNRAAHSGGALSTGAWAQTAMVIRDTVAAENFAEVAGSAYNFAENFSSWGTEPAILIEGGRIIGNGAGGGDAAIKASSVVIRFAGVDLGAGEEDNPGGDLHGCPANYGPDTTLTYTAIQNAVPICQ